MKNIKLTLINLRMATAVSVKVAIRFQYNIKL
jgi:hypothetical protein